VLAVVARGRALDFSRLAHLGKPGKVCNLTSEPANLLTVRQSWTPLDAQSKDGARESAECARVARGTGRERRARLECAKLEGAGGRRAMRRKRCPAVWRPRHALSYSLCERAEKELRRRGRGDCARARRVRRG
jgi:hypothetical protein